MNNPMLMLYLADVLPSITGVLFFCLFAASIFVCVLFFLWVETNSHRSEEEQNKEFNRTLKKPLIVLSCIFVLWVLFVIFIPSQKTIHMMMGAHYLSNDKLPEKVIKVLNHKLDEIIKDE